MQFRVLGGLEVSDDGVVLDLGGPKQRLLLAVLLMADGRAVSVDRLIDSLWADDPPARAEASLQAYVSNLRRLLEPGRRPREAPTVLVTKAGGYALEVERDDVDAARFEALVVEGDLDRRRGDPARASELLGRALSTWGPVLPEFADDPHVRATAERLEPRRISALEAWFEARLELGESSSLVPELRAVVTEVPFHERFWSQLALAHYRAGQQTDALRAVQEARQVLADEVGVEPGAELRELERDMLEQSPALIWVAPPPPITTSAATAAPAPAPVSTTNFVGRERELGVLIDAARRAAAGEGSAVVISGEPGIGKTRLAEELATVARRMGFATAWGRCPESAASAAFWAISQVGDQLVEQGVIPQLGRVELRGVERPVTPEMADERLDLHRRVVESFREVTQPTLVVIDDLQWADPASLRLVEFVAGELRDLSALFVATTRPTDSSSPQVLVDCLGELARAAGSSRLSLEGLSVDEVGDWLQRRSEGRADARVTELVHDRSGGNPFFAQELVELLVGEGHFAASGLGDDGLASTRVPAAVADVVRRRVGRLPAATQQLLSIASVVGRSFDLDVVAEVAGEPMGELLGALDPAVDAGLVTADPDAMARFRFSHALVAEALDSELAPSRRARLHAATTAAIERLRAGSIDAHLAELAHHALGGAMAGTARQAVEWSVRAPELADASLAPEDAAGHYERGLLACELAHPGDVRIRYDLTLALADARFRGGNEIGSHVAFADAIELALQLDDVAAMLAAARGLSQPTIWQPGGYRESNTELTRLIDRVLERVDADADPASFALLLAIKAIFSYYSSTPEELDEMSGRAVEVARATGDVELLARTLLHRLQSIWFPTTAELRSADAGELAELARREGLDLPLHFTGEFSRLLADYQLGRVDDAEIARVAVIEREAASPIQSLEWGTFIAPRLASEGRYVDALALASTTGDLFRRTRRFGGDVVQFAGMLISFIDQGMFDELGAVLASMDQGTYEVSISEMLGIIFSEFGQLEEARACVGPVGSVPDRPFDWLWLSTSYTASMVRIALDDVVASEQLYAELLPYAGQISMAGSMPISGCIDLVLGGMARLVGDEDAAARHLDAAIELETRMGSRAWLARAYEAKAQLTGETDDRDRALALATEIGCAPVLRRLAAT